MIYPLDYQEFLLFHELPSGNDAFMKYLQFGGLPYLRHLDMKPDIIYPYLRDVVDTIILRDVISRYSIRNVDFYKKLITYISSETGSIFSAKSISDYLKSQRISLSTNAVLNYIEYSIYASFLGRIRRYDIRGKRYFEFKEKYYFTDIGIKNALL
jgi:uncharacterized protein